MFRYIIIGLDDVIAGSLANARRQNRVEALVGGVDPAGYRDLIVVTNLSFDGVRSREEPGSRLSERFRPLQRILQLPSKSENFICIRVKT